MASEENYSLRRESERIFRDILLTDARLQLPPKVSELAHHTFFDALGTVDTPYLPVPFKITESSSALWALAATFGSAIVKDRLGMTQNVHINTDKASLFLASCALARVSGKPISDPSILSRCQRYDLGRMSDPYRRLCTNIYPTRDGRFFHLHGSMNADKSLAMVGLPKTDSDLTAKGEDSIVQAYISTMRKLDSDWLDAEANEYWRQAGSICYTEAEFRTSEQGRATADDGLYLLQQFDKDTLPPVPYSPVRTDEQARTAGPLHGLKLLDISRVIAAPTIAKLAALFGATVIRVSCASQPDMGPLLVDGNLGKRDVSLDLKSDDGRETLRRLVADADIVLDGYRPGALERLGFGVAYLHTLARRRGRGIVVVRENCYGWHGPWAHRAGWQQISDCVTGVAWAMGRFLDLDEPVVPPLPNSDYQTGLAGLIGIMAAVDRRATEGGSYTVDVSLNQYNQFLLQLGAHTPAVQRHLRALHPQFGPRHFDDMTRLTGKVLRSMYGSVPQLFKPEYFSHILSNLSGDDGTPETLTYVLSAATYDATRLGYDVGSCFLGAYAPEWP